MTKPSRKQVKITKKHLFTDKKLLKNLKKYTETIKPTTEAKAQMLGREKYRVIIGIWPRFMPGKIEKTYGPIKAEFMREVQMMTKQDREAFRQKGPVTIIPNEDLKTHLIYCRNCGALNAVVRAKNSELWPWHEVWHVNFHDKNRWYGTRAVNVSPKDYRLGFECACGIDTRDARFNKQLPPVARRLTWEWVKKRRQFNNKDSAFNVVEYK